MAPSVPLPTAMYLIPSPVFIPWGLRRLARGPPPHPKPAISLSSLLPHKHVHPQAGLGPLPSTALQTLHIIQPPIVGSPRGLCHWQLLPL